jgi:hypothetical protein
MTGRKRLLKLLLIGIRRNVITLDEESATVYALHS